MDLEDSKPILSHYTLARDAVPPCQVQNRKTSLTKPRHMDRHMREERGGGKKYKEAIYMDQNTSHSFHSSCTGK